MIKFVCLYMALPFSAMHLVASHCRAPEEFGITKMGYTAYTKESEEWRSKQTGLRQLIVGDKDVLYRCIEEVRIKVTKYFPDGHVEESIRSVEEAINPLTVNPLTLTTPLRHKP